jgi:hypothetical protein
MRIMHMLNHTRPSNGHVHVAVDLACVQARMGHSVSVVSGGGAFDSLFAAYGVKHIVIDQQRRFLNLIRATCKLRSAISAVSPEIIHAHMMTSAGLAFLLCTRVPTAFLYLVGDGPCRQAYEELASRTGFGERIRFCGSQAGPRPYLLGSDLFVLASHAKPGALVLAEAREAGCAIIATSVDGIPEMLDGGKAGIVVPLRRPDLLAGAITEVLGDKELLAEMRARSRSNLDYFTVDRAAREYRSVYSNVLH